MDTEQDMDGLLVERNEFVDADISDAAYGKLSTMEFKPGDRVKITWTGGVLDGIEDEGYLFQLPVCDDQFDMLDFFVHIPNPDNSSGIGDAPQIFCHFIALMENKLVKSIQLIEKQK